MKGQIGQLRAGAGHLPPRRERDIFPLKGCIKVDICPISAEEIRCVFDDI